jgi:hypothetical protein
VKEGVAELFESNPELDSIGTPQQYSAYLDTIFPDSKVKDIVYHSTYRPLEYFDKVQVRNGYGSGAIFFADFEYANHFGNYSPNTQINGVVAQKTIIPTLVNIKNPLQVSNVKFHRRRLKPSWYPPGGTQDARDILARNKNNDGLIGVDFSEKENTTYVVRDSDQTHILGSKQDIEGFKQFVAQKPAQAPVTREVEDASGKKFPGLLKEQVGVTPVLDMETGEIMELPKVYNESDFVNNNMYVLNTETVKQIGAENPGKLFVFDDYFVTRTGASMDSIDRSNTRQAWIAGKPMGISFGIPSLTIGGPTAIPVTDQNYNELKAQIDKALDGLLEKKRQGLELVFPSRGLGQNFLGFTIEPTKNVKTNNRPAPSLFVYLSKRLLQDFGYRNVTLSILSNETAGVSELLGTESGAEFVQEYYKNIGLQTVTDKDIKEFIKKCKGLS